MQSWNNTSDWLETFPQEFSWYTGLIFRGINFKQKDGGYFLVVAAKQPAGERVVNYQWGNTMAEAWAQFEYGATHKTGLKWYPDKYAK